MSAKKKEDEPKKSNLVLILPMPARRENADEDGRGVLARLEQEGSPGRNRSRPMQEHALTSLTLSPQPASLQIDTWMPIQEVRAIVNKTPLP